MAGGHVYQIAVYYRSAVANTGVLTKQIDEEMPSSALNFGHRSGQDEVLPTDEGPGPADFWPSGAPQDLRQPRVVASIGKATVSGYIQYTWNPKVESF